MRTAKKEINEVAKKSAKRNQANISPQFLKMINLIWQKGRSYQIRI